MGPKTKGTRSSPKKRQAPAKAAAHGTAGLLGTRKLQQLYTAMLQCRLIAEEADRVSKEGKSASNHSAGGQEATEVGAIMGLGPLDCLAPRKRNLVAGFIVGVPLAEVIARLYAPKPGSADLLPDARDRRPLIISGPEAMAARINISTGVALAYKTRKKPGVVVVFSGNDSTALVSWREAVDFAIAHRLPIVHVVQDDLGSGSVNGGDQATAHADAGKTSIPTLVVDGNDVVAVYRVAHEAIRRARQGYGPTLIECKTHRWPGYSGIAPAQNPPSLGHGQPRGVLHDPVAAMEVYLAQKGLWSEAWKQTLVKTFRKRLDAAMVAARSRP